MLSEFVVFPLFVLFFSRSSVGFELISKESNNSRSWFGSEKRGNTNKQS